MPYTKKEKKYNLYCFKKYLCNMKYIFEQFLVIIIIQVPVSEKSIVFEVKFVSISISHWPSTTAVSYRGYTVAAQFNRFNRVTNSMTEFNSNYPQQQQQYGYPQQQYGGNNSQQQQFMGNDP